MTMPCNTAITWQLACIITIQLRMKGNNGNGDSASDDVTVSLKYAAKHRSCTISNTGKRDMPNRAPAASLGLAIIAPA